MWRMRKSVKRKWTIGIVFCLLQCIGWLGCYTVVRYSTARKYSALLEEQATVVQQARRTVYITRTCVKAGEVFSVANTEQRTVLSEQNPEGLETNALGKVACGDLPEGSIISKAVCCEPDVLATERECVLRDVKNADCFPDGTVVELRIRYDNGENYCVIKKKRLEKREEKSDVCRFYLTEEEQLLLSGAQYDVQNYDEAELYMVGFKEERIQAESGCDYPPPAQIVMQLSELNETYEKSSEQLDRERRALEERLAEYRRKRKEGL